MASIKLTGDTSGEITISAPAVAGTNTLTLPATTGSLMTSTFTGDINFDSDTLVVDSTNNRVGIGTSSPSVPLDVNGITRTVNAYSLGYTGVAGSTSAFGAGTISTDSNWGMYFRATTGAAVADFAWVNGAGTERMRIDSSGNLLVAKTNTTQYTSGCIFRGNNTTSVISADNDGLAVWADNITANTGGTKGHILFKRGTNSVLVGSITSSTTSTSYNTSSDYRLKENVDYTFDATTRLKQLKPCRFNFIADESNTLVDGFIAHEVSSIVPEAITGTKDATKVQDVYDDDGNVTGTETVPDYQGIDQSKLVPLLVKTCQEQQTIIEDLQTRITALENN